MADMKIYQEVELSLTENLVPTVVHVKQFDHKARKIRCRLYSSSVGVCHSGGRHRQLRGDPAGWPSLPVQLGDSAGAGVYRRKYRHLYRHGFHDSGVWQIPRGCDPPG